MDGGAERSLRPDSGQWLSVVVGIQLTPTVIQLAQIQGCHLAAQGGICNRGLPIGAPGAFARTQSLHKVPREQMEKLRNRVDYTAGDARKTARIIALVTGADRRVREDWGGWGLIFIF